MVLRLDTGARIDEEFTLSPTATCRGLMRTKLDQESLQRFAVPLSWFRVHNSLQPLPATGSADDLGLYPGTFGASNSATLKTGDLKAAGATTRYARALIPVPKNYDAGADMVFRISAGMETTIADTTATVDLEAILSDREGGGGSDICATAAQDINSLTFGDKDFVITATSVEGGDILDVRLALAVNDGASGTDVIASIGAVELLCDTRG